MASLPVSVSFVREQLYKDLKAAVDDENINRVKELLDSFKKRDIESGSCTLEWDDGYNLLRDAVRRHSKVADLLLDYGVKTNRKSNHACNTPLHLAVKNHDFKMVKKLLIKGAKTRAKTSQGKTPLYLAAELNDEKILELLLEKDAEPAVNIKYRLRPIECAAQHGHQKIFDILVSCGAKVDLKYGRGTSMFHVAVEKGYYTTVRKIIDQKNYDATDPLNNKLLTAAVIDWRPDYIVSLLIDAKFKIDPEKINDAEFIHTVAEKGFCAIIDDLLALGANPNILNSYGDSLLITACKNKKADVAKILLKNKADFTIKNSLKHTVLYYIIKNLHSKSYQVCSYIDLRVNSNECNAAKKNLDYTCTCYSNEWFEILITLINLGIDVNTKDEKNWTPLHLAAVSNDWDKYYHYIKVLATLLIEAGANVCAVNDDGNTPLQLSIDKACLEMVELLLPMAEIDDDCYVNYDKQTLIHTAAQSHSIEILKMLLERKEFKNVNIQDIDGETPLLLAIKSSYRSNIEILLQHGADVNLANNEMKTPLFCTLEFQREVSRLEILLKYGANVNCITKKGKTPSLIAALHDHDGDLKILVKYGADLDAKIDESGQTALHYCASHRDHKTSRGLSKLLKFGANVNVLDNNNNTALDYLIKSMVSYCKMNNDVTSENVSSMKIYTSQYRENAHIYIEHVLKLQTINSFVCQENVCSMYTYDDKFDWLNDVAVGKKRQLPKIEEIRKMCQKEVDLMKQYTFQNTNVNIYQILTKCPHRVAKYILKNENVIQQFKNPDFVEKFPIYRNLLDLRIQKCLERKEMLDQDTLGFHYVLPSLPFHCIDEILSYLSNNDLKVLISVCQLSMNRQDIESKPDVSTTAVEGHVTKKQKI